MFLKLYLVALPIFFILDLAWIGFVARNFYQSQIGFLLKPAVNWPAAILFYLLFIAGIIVFVVTPAIEKQSWIQAVAFGAFFGLVTYATYDLTNLAMTKDWPLAVTIVDLAWGSILSASVSVTTYAIAMKWIV
jgi:uncharacterized membrane protein